LASFCETIRQHLAKYEKLFPALALVLHLVECAASGKRGPVTMAAAIRAVAWCRYLETHARRCYGLIADEGFRAAQALAKRIKDCELPKNFNPEDFTARDVRRNQWRYLTKDDAVKAALDWLEDEGWIRAKKATSTEGRPTQRSAPQRGSGDAARKSENVRSAYCQNCRN
jgi:hypothetical protein